MDDEAIDFEELEFHSLIRSHVVCFLLFTLLYAISFSIIQYFKTRTDSDELYADEGDYFVYRISVWFCTCSLAVSIGAVILLPFSVLGSEILHSYPDNYYLKWLNWSFLNSLWNHVFLLSNISLFFLLPFSYFFIESQGFSFQQRPKPFLSRVYETIVNCALMIVMLVGLAHVFYSLFVSEKLSVNFSIFNVSGLSIPLVYSFVSLVGAFLLLLSTPLGFAKMFDLSSKSLFEKDPNSPVNSSDYDIIDHQDDKQTKSCPDSPLTRRLTINGPLGDNVRMRKISKATNLLKPLCQSQPQLSRIRRLIKASADPLWILILLVLTVLSISMVLINALQLLFGFRELPGYVQFVEVHSRHSFGVAGAIVENIIILYIMVSAIVGVYSIPILGRMKPVRRRTSMTCVIVNCSTILLLSSALPVLARTLGITSFDLLPGWRITWISNISLVLLYNVVFLGGCILVLLSKFTAQLRLELKKRMHSLYNSSSDKKAN